MNTSKFSKVPLFYQNYIKNVEEDNLEVAFEKMSKTLIQQLSEIPSQKWSYRYAEGKWNIKEMVQHIIDTERIFSYRALCIARQDTTPLPGFDENKYADSSQADKRNEKDILAEFKIVRTSAEHLFLSFNNQQLKATGIANGNPISVEAIAFILLGHGQHHLNILKERYL